MWFAVFWECVCLVFGFVVGPFSVVEDALRNCVQVVLYVLVCPVVCVEGACRVVVGVFRGIPFVAPVVVPAPPML